MSLAAAILSGLNPLVVVMAILMWKMWASKRHLPKGCGKIRTEASKQAYPVLSWSFVWLHVLGS